MQQPLQCVKKLKAVNVLKDPQPVEPWIEAKNCLEAGSSSPCLNFMNNTIVGSENCLVLNVYTKEVRRTIVCK